MLSSVRSLLLLAAACALVGLGNVLPCAAQWDYSTPVTADSAKEFVQQVNFSIPMVAEASGAYDATAVDPGYQDYVQQGYVVRNQVVAFNGTVTAQQCEDYANSVLFASFCCTNTNEKGAKPPTPINMVTDLVNYYVCFVQNMNAIGWAMTQSTVQTRYYSSTSVTLGLDIMALIDAAFNKDYRGMAWAAVSSLKKTDDGAYSLYHQQSQSSTDNQFQVSAVSLSQGLPNVNIFFSHFEGQSNSWQVLWVTYSTSNYNYQYYAQTFLQVPGVWDDEFRNEIRTQLGQTTKEFVRSKKFDFSNANPPPS